MVHERQRYAVEAKPDAGAMADFTAAGEAECSAEMLQMVVR
jgi:hypothetical protein